MAAIITVVLLCVPAAPAPGTTAADLKARIRSIQKSLDAVGRSLSAAERDLTYADAAIAKHREALARAQARRGILREAISRRASELYQSGNAGAFQMLAQGGDIDLLLDRLSYIDQLRRGEAAMLEQVEALRHHAAEESASLRSAHVRAERLRDTLANRQQSLRSKLSELQRMQNFLGSLSGRTILRSSRTGSRGLVCPVIGFQYVSNNYGDPRPGGPHTGIDISAQYGRPVVAALPATVVDTPYGGWIGIGIVIRDLAGNEWWYAHLSAETVRVGQRVAAGELIGRVGCSGTCYGSHLHFEYHPGGGGPQNPYPFVSRAC